MLSRTLFVSASLPVYNACSYGVYIYIYIYEYKYIYIYIYICVYCHVYWRQQPSVLPFCEKPLADGQELAQSRVAGNKLKEDGRMRVIPWLLRRFRCWMILVSKAEESLQHPELRCLAADWRGFQSVNKLVASS